MRCTGRARERFTDVPVFHLVVDGQTATHNNLHRGLVRLSLPWGESSALHLLLYIHLWHFCFLEIVCGLCIVGMVGLGGIRKCYFVSGLLFCVFDCLLFEFP